MNGNSQPLEIAMDFIQRINAGDINALCEAMTENHIFQDALGKRFMGRETMRQGWTNYLKMVADYQVHADEFFVTDERVAIFGTASGRYVGPHIAGAKAGSGVPALSWAFENASPKLSPTPMTSPVERISGPRIMSVPGNLLKGKTASFT